jgi:hypothetical protein
MNETQRKAAKDCINKDQRLENFFNYYAMIKNHGVNYGRKR